MQPGWKVGFFYFYIPQTMNRTKLKPSDRINQTGEYYFSMRLRQLAELNQQGRNIMNLAIGNPDLPPAPEVISSLQHAAAEPNIHGYQSYQGLPSLRNAMAQWYAHHYGVQLNANTNILPLMGSKEGLMHIAQAFLNAGDTVLIPNPGYPAYKSVANMVGANYLEYGINPQNGEPVFQLDEKQLQAIKMIFVNYPHMPTGATASVQTLQKIQEKAQKYNWVVVNDNPYSFLTNGAPVSMLQVDKNMENTIELNSLSKSHNMAGWRVGMVVSNPEYISHILIARSNTDSGMFYGLQKAAITALQLPDTWYQTLRHTYSSRRSLGTSIMQSLGCHVAPGQQGMFVWASVPNGFENGFAFSDYLVENAGVFIAPGGIFGNAGNEFVRMSLCSNEQILQEASVRVSSLKKVAQ